MVYILQKLCQFIQNRQNVKIIQNVSVKGVAYIPPSLSASVGFTLHHIKNTMKNKTKKLKFSDFKKGEFIKKVGSHIELKIIEVGKDWRSGKKFITFYDDVMGYSTTIVDLSNYIKV